MSRLPVLVMSGMLPSMASAHAFGQRYDLPLPLGLYLAGAGAVVALSFIIAVLFLRNGGQAEHGWNMDLGSSLAGRVAHAPVVKMSLRVLGVMLFALVIAAGFIAGQDPASNFAPIFVWVIWWVGLTYVVALLGNLWDVLDPWRNIYMFLSWMTGGRHKPLLGYPSKLGAWPAVLLLLVFAWLEFISGVAHRPAELAGIILVYTAITLIGMRLFGMQLWLRNGEAFNLVFGLVARFGLFHGEPGRLVLRLPGAGLVQREPLSFSMMAFSVLMLTTVTFDGFIETPLWNTIYSQVYTQLSGLDAVAASFEPRVLQQIIYSIALLLFYALFFGVYLGICAGCHRLGRESTSVTETARAYVLALVPIAIAYHLAHYLSYLLLAGQLLIPVLSDPLGLGWDLLGTSGYTVDIGVIDAGDVWTLAVSAIVIGHIIAVCVAHATALRREASRRAAVIGQLPMLVLMVAYTMLSLWILSQPVVS